jgi:hypothetical protein
VYFEHVAAILMILKNKHSGGRKVSGAFVVVFVSGTAGRHAAWNNVKTA